MTPKARLLKFLQKNPNKRFIKGELVEIAHKHTGMYHETFSRYLREFAEDGKIKRGYNEKNHVIYWYEPSKYEKLHYTLRS